MDGSKKKIDPPVFFFSPCAPLDSLGQGLLTCLIGRFSISSWYYVFVLLSLFTATLHAYNRALVLGLFTVGMRSMVAARGREGNDFLRLPSTNVEAQRVHPTYT